MGQEVQARKLGRKLSGVRSDPRPVAIPISGGEVVTGIEWRTSDAAILFLHSTDDELALDSWGAWPDRFAELGYSVLVVDLPIDRLQDAVEASIGYLAALRAPRRFVIAAGDALGLLDAASADAFVLIAPQTTDSNPLTLGITPKLIVAGTIDPEAFQPVEAYARACRGWSVLSTYATENTVAALLEGRHAVQAGSQIAGFLQEYRAARSSS